MVRLPAERELHLLSTYSEMCQELSFVMGRFFWGETDGYTCKVMVELYCAYLTGNKWESLIT